MRIDDELNIGDIVSWSGRIGKVSMIHQSKPVMLETGEKTNLVFVKFDDENDLIPVLKSQIRFP